MRQRRITKCDRFKNYKVPQSWITNYNRFWIAKCDKNSKKWITKCDGITKRDGFQSATVQVSTTNEQCLRIVYKDNICSFTIHQRNIQSLATQLFNVKRNLSNSIEYDIFQTRNFNNTT